MPRAIATNTAVDLQGLLAFVRPRHRMVLVTRRRDGDPQLSPVTGGVDSQGRIVISTYPERAKVANLRRNSRCSVLVQSDEWNGPWVQVDASRTDRPQTRDLHAETDLSVRAGMKIPDL